VKRTIRGLARLIAALPLLLFTLLLLAFAAAAIAVADLLAAARRREPLPEPVAPDTAGASIVIPNWNGRDLLSKYLPSVIAATVGNDRNEIIVVDNGSTDGSAEFVRSQFPSVRALALDTNRGFGGGSNAGVQAARNDIVVLLNSDMRVAPDFLPPLLEAFADARVFAVACQILFSDPGKRREETGLTEGRWRNGGLWVSHRDDPLIERRFPCFYPGGGSSAFDKRKFLELGGFDELLSPFYFEDTDLGFMAWKRGWAVLYEPRSVVWHEHRGTIGRTFSDRYIFGVLGKNRILFCWKNIHEWRRLARNFAVTAVRGARLSGCRAVMRAFAQLPAALRSRTRARDLVAVSDTEAFRRPSAGWFHDRFTAAHQPPPARLRVLFVSPYPMCPPVHGGAVFMYHMVRALARSCELHLLIILDYPEERAGHRELENIAASVTYFDRTENRRRELTAITPHAVHEIENADLQWIVQREIYQRGIDIIQLEYTSMAQYGIEARRIGCVLFEHDVYFQSVGRGLRHTAAGKLPKSAFEYLRALRFESTKLPQFDRVQVCSQANADYLLSFVPKLRGRIDPDLRAGIDVASYPFTPFAGREPHTMLFLGSFRHTPNVRALEWFLAAVMPRLEKLDSQARLIVAGAEMPPGLAGSGPTVEVLGYVPEVRDVLARYAVFVCPILSGSGVRVKLLEAFASGIPVVSTRLGAEGLAEVDGEYCRLADSPDAFARSIAEIFAGPGAAAEMATRARQFVESEKNIPILASRLVESWRAILDAKRPAAWNR